MNRTAIISIFLFYILHSTADAEASKHYHPVDISFLVADIKYSKEKGAQICEIQHEIDSTFKGDAFSNGGISLIAENFYEFFLSCNKPVWAFLSNFSDDAIKNKLLEQSMLWNVLPSTNHHAEELYLQFNSLPVENSDRIENYQGFIFANAYTSNNFSPSLEPKSIILIDRATLPVWKDKYKVSLCFRGTPQLESCKPRWNLYPTKYSPDLASRIANEIGSDRFVIKPRGKFKGNGVIIVDKKDLNRTLKYIFSRSKKLKKNSDRAYRNWYYETSETFLVEEFVPSDTIIVPHLKKKKYCPTLRIAFLCVFDQGNVGIHLLGGYYCLPKKAVSDSGSLHDRYKTSLKTIHSSKVDAQVLEKVFNELYNPLCFFYKKVLGVE